MPIRRAEKKKKNEQRKKTSVSKYLNRGNGIKEMIKLLVIYYLAGVLLLSCFGVLGLFIEPKQYATSDLNDYGHYIGNGDNQFASEYINAFFPEKIESSFTDVTYSYRAQDLGNYAFEAYLEFVIEDEKEFQEFISEKTAGMKSKVFSYDSDFVEYELDDSLRVSVLDGEENQNGKIWIDEAQIGKILCNEKEHRIIFVAMAMRDAWDAYCDFFCCFFNRFNIDPVRYRY